MATQTVEFPCVTGQTVTAKLFSFGSDTEVASVSATEATNRKGLYSAAFTDVAAGTYRLIALNGSSVPLAAWDVTLTLTTATFQAYDIGMTVPLIAANVTHYGGTAGTFSGGRPEANTTHWAGTAVGSVTVNSNMTKISGDTQAATQLALSAATIVSGTVDNTAFTPTTTEFEADNITEATTQHYNGRTIIFTSGVLLNQATSISNYSLVTGRGHFTVVALTEAPGNNDTFIIV